MRYGRQLGAQALPHGDVVTEVSRGSRTVVNGKTVRVGNIELHARKRRNRRFSPARPIPARSPTMWAWTIEIVAVLYAMDSPRENVRRAINSLRYDGVGDIELLTGDMESQARTVAEQVGADGYRAQLLPEQKAEAVLKLQVQGNGVVMVGDGINDAPALAYADVGISMGSKSTDIAMETSDVIINRDDPDDDSRAAPPVPGHHAHRASELRAGHRHQLRGPDPGRGQRHLGDDERAAA